MICKSVKSNKYWGTMVAVGVVTLMFGQIAYKNISNDIHNIAMLKGMFFGLGISFTVIGLLKLIQNKRTPQEKLKAKEIESKDERNIQILRIAYSVSNVMATILFAAMAFLFVRLNYVIPAFISLGAIYIQLLTFIIVHRYYNSKM